jgi:hypothetical protein
LISDYRKKIKESAWDSLSERTNALEDLKKELSDIIKNASDVQTVSSVITDISSVVTGVSSLLNEDNIKNFVNMFQTRLILMIK